MTRRIAVSLLLLAGAGVWAEDATTPGEASAPYPTITNLSIEWKIAGDDNRNGKVEVEYRRAGETTWQRALPLRRVAAGSSTGTRPIFHWENKHSGSIFDLRPDTEYEVRLKLSDREGGAAEKVLRARTRPVPRAAAGAPVRRVTTETLRPAAAQAQPGDVLLLAAGQYGSFDVPRDGAPGKPIVFRCAAGVVFDAVSLRDRRRVHLEGATVHGRVDLTGGEDLAVRRCTVNTLYGITAARPPGAKNCYIADNVVTGIMPWESARMGHLNDAGQAANQGEGIQITGPGNVICYNRVRGFRDAISLMEDQSAHQQVSVDIYNNDIYVGADDGIEADFAMGNCRILRNRLTNCFMGLSSQPGLGGPTYFIRNVMYNLTNSGFKLSRGSIGDVLLHNTVVKVGDAFRTGDSPSLSRNNLCIGGPGGGKFGIYSSGMGLALSLRPAGDADLDYDGVGLHELPFRASVSGVSFETLEELRRRTSQKHAVQVDMSVFDGVAFPNPPIPERPTPDLRLRPGSAAVDAGVVLPNVNDGYRGAAPDLGAYELGQDLPMYGPRPEGLDEETALAPRGRGR